MKKAAGTQKERHPKGCLSFGTAEGIRTPDLLVRSQTLYPAELQPHTALKGFVPHRQLIYDSTAPLKMQEQFLKNGAKKRVLTDAEILVCAPRRKRLPSCGETVLLELKREGERGVWSILAR